MILYQLAAHGERSGAEIVRGSGDALLRGTVYTTLVRMEEKGYVKSRQGKVPAWGGPPTRHYEATDFGAEVYEWTTKAPSPADNLRNGA